MADQTKQTTEPTGKTEPTQAESDATVLREAMAAPRGTVVTATPENAPEAAPDATEGVLKEDAVPVATEQKNAQYKNKDAAIAGIIHYQKKLSEKSQEGKDKDARMARLEAETLEMRRQLDAKAAPVETPVSESDDPLAALIDQRAREIVAKEMAPLKDGVARREADTYEKSMETEFGPSWKGLQDQRDDLVGEWKDGKVKEPEIWQLAVIGKAYLDGATKISDVPGAEGSTGTSATDESGAVKAPADLGQPKGKTDSEVLRDAMAGLSRRPHGVTPVD